MKPGKAQRLMAVGAPLGMMSLLLGAEINSRAAAPASPATSPTTASTSAPAFAAMAYYDQNCAHCHGPQGSFYGPTLGQALTDPQLSKAVNDMASGAGNAPLAPDQLPAVTAFHRSLVMRNPYLSVTQMQDDGKWGGETMPDAKVVIIIGEKRIEATSDDSGWSAQLPAGTKASEVKITAELNGVMTTLEPAQEGYSNSQPLPPPGHRPK
jgi:mono/diheme cytochrome c family protein